MSEEEESHYDGRRKATDEQIIEALDDCYGIVAAAARYLFKKHTIRITRSGLKRRIDASPKLSEARHAAEIAGCEFAESALLKAIKDGKVAAIIFYLQSRSEKYRPRIETEVTPPKPRSEEELKAELAKLGFKEV